MIPYKHILVPIDFSGASRRALETAVELGKRYDATITLLHVYGMPAHPINASALATSVDQVSKLMTAIRGALELEKAVAMGRGAREVHLLIGEGSAAKDIVREATRLGCDLIVMGAHGQGVVEHLVLGSVAERVVRHAPCPVMTVHDRPAAANADQRAQA